MGINGIQELLYAVLVVFSLFYVAYQFINESRIVRTDAIVIFLVFFGIIYSSMLSHIHFDQPLQLGLLEERRILAFLVYFPIIWALRAGIINVDQLLSWIVVAALICSIFSILIYIGLISPLNIKETTSILREERYSIGQFHIALASLIIVSRLTYTNFFQSILLLVLFLGVLIVIVQTRQILIAMLIALIYLRGPIKFSIWLIPTILISYIAYSNIDVFNAFVEKYFTLLNTLLSESYATESARSLTITTIFKELSEGNWFGLGAVSPLFNGGFPNIYHSNFYLADVGLFGTIYKFGIVSIPLYLTYYIVQSSTLIRIRQHKHTKLLVSIWILLIATFPVAATIEYRGYISGLLLAISIGCLLDSNDFSKTSVKILND